MKTTAAATAAAGSGVVIQDDLPEMPLEADEAELAAVTAAAAVSGSKASGGRRGKQQQQQQQFEQLDQDPWEEQPWEDIAARDTAGSGAGADSDDMLEDEDVVGANESELEALMGRTKQQQSGVGAGAGAPAVGFQDVSDPDLLGEYLFAADGDQPFDPEKGGYIRPRAGPALDGDLRGDFDMFDLDLDFDGGMDDFFDSMGDPFGGSFMADFGAPGRSHGLVTKLAAGLFGSWCRARGADHLCRCFCRFIMLICIFNRAHYLSWYLQQLQPHQL
jgi:hypothetical protein